MKDFEGIQNNVYNFGTSLRWHLSGDPAGFYEALQYLMELGFEVSFSSSMYGYKIHVTITVCDKRFSTTQIQNDIGYAMYCVFRDIVQYKEEPSDGGTEDTGRVVTNA